MANPQVMEQQLEDLIAYFNANLGTYLSAIDSRLTAPIFARGASNLMTLGRSKYPAGRIVRDPGSAERSGNQIADVTQGYNIGIAITETRPATLELHMGRYLDAVIELVLENPTLGGICFVANLTEWETVPPDPEGGEIGLIVFGLELEFEVTTTAV